jgi:hypothetical protein
MNPLDALTGRLPMYRLVTLSLLVLVAVSLVLSATGALFYSPVELLASLLVTGSRSGSGRTANRRSSPDSSCSSCSCRRSTRWA